MTMLKKIAAVLVSLTAALLLIIGLAGTATAETTADVDPTAAPVTGTLADATGAVAGTFDVQNFIAENGTLQAVGTFTGTVTDASGHSTQGTQQLALPVDLAQSAGSCQILDLVLGPVDLDLLGLRVHLDTVHLNITAQSGPGNSSATCSAPSPTCSTAASPSTRSSARSLHCSTNCSPSSANRHHPDTAPFAPADGAAAV